MNNNSTGQQSRFEQKKRTIISLLLGIISLIPGMGYGGIVYILSTGGGNNYLEKYFSMLEKYWFIFFPFAVICGIAGFILGIKSLKAEKFAILGIILSILGIGSSLLILVFGLYTAGF